LNQRSNNDLHQENCIQKSTTMTDTKNVKKRKATPQELAHKRKRYNENPHVKKRASAIKKIQYACLKGHKPKDEDLTYLGYDSLANFAKDFKCVNLHLQGDSANIPILPKLGESDIINGESQNGSEKEMTKEAKKKQLKGLIATVEKIALKTTQQNFDRTIDVLQTLIDELQTNGNDSKIEVEDNDQKTEINGSKDEQGSTPLAPVNAKQSSKLGKINAKKKNDESKNIVSI